MDIVTKCSRRYLASSSESQLLSVTTGSWSMSCVNNHNNTQTSVALNPLRLQYVILRTKSQNHCDSCTYIYIYVHGLCDRNMGLLQASNRHFTVSPHEVFTCFRSVASIRQHVYQVGRKVEFARSCALFLASFGKL